MNSGFLDGLGVVEAKRAIIEWLVKEGYGEGTVTSKLRDWLFSRQRYWGEPFPIVYDETGLPIALPESMLPVELPDVDDYSPQSYDPDDEHSEPAPPLGNAEHWVERRARPGRRAEALPPRDQHHAAVGRLVLVRAALPGPDERERLRRPGGRAVLDGAAVRGRLWRRRPVRRRRRARRAAPAVRPVLAQGAVRPGLRLELASRSGGCSTRATSWPPPTPTSGVCTSRPPTWRSATAASSWGSSR